MLSGDNQRTVDAIAREADIDEAHGDLLPDQKIERIRKLLVEHNQVGMIGDGVNDAPAMAAATIGIAMGAARADTAIETADIALMKDDLSEVAKAIHLGRRTLRVIQFNIAFSIAVKLIFIVLAVFGYTSLWFAIAADTGATLIVTANALRLLRVEPPAYKCKEGVARISRVRAEEEQREQNQISYSREFLICASFLNEAFKALKRSLAEMVFQAMNVV